MEETTTAAHAPMMPADRKANGKRLRDRVPRDAHAGWRAHAGRADPIGILHAADAPDSRIWKSAGACAQPLS
jgi:hypothetical protein